MLEPREDPADLLVAEPSRSLVAGDAARQLLPDEEMAGPPGHLLARAEEATGGAAHRALAGRSGGAHVELEAAGEIEAPFRRRGDSRD
jgi:hypothetical protein